jgi:uncharacterized protein
VDLGPDELRAVLGLEPHPTRSDIRAGMRPQLLIPDGTFHTSRLPDGGWALLASTEWPGVEPADVEQGDPERLAASHPDAADWLHSQVHPTGAAPFPR